MPFTYTAEGDIETAIMTALQTVFTAELITAVPTSDKLRIRRLDAAPLQDDPTTTAPYLIYSPAWEIGRSLSPLGIVEIGGGALWSTPFRATCGTPRQATKQLAYQMINNLSTRIERVLMRHYDLSGILAAGTLYSADRSEFLDGDSPVGIELTCRRRVYGGDTEFYGEALLYWEYNFERVRDW